MLTTTTYLDGDGKCKDTNDISFNENSIFYTSMQNSTNIFIETTELNQHIERLPALIRQSRRLLKKNKLGYF